MKSIIGIIIFELLTLSPKIMAEDINIKKIKNTHMQSPIKIVESICLLPSYVCEIRELSPPPQVFEYEKSRKIATYFKASAKFRLSSSLAFIFGQNKVTRVRELLPPQLTEEEIDISPENLRAWCENKKTQLIAFYSECI